jgi:hypothetical protein
MDTFAPNGGAAVNFALLSYQDRASIGMNIDPAAIPDTRLFVDSIKAGFEAVINPERSAVGRVPAGRSRRSTKRS